MRRSSEFARVWRSWLVVADDDSCFVCVYLYICFWHCFVCFGEVNVDGEGWSFLVFLVVDSVDDGLQCCVGAEWGFNIVLGR